jgi:hypothetical protein
MADNCIGHKDARPVASCVTSGPRGLVNQPMVRPAGMGMLIELLANVFTIVFAIIASCGHVLLFKALWPNWAAGLAEAHDIWRVDLEGAHPCGE